MSNVQMHYRRLGNSGLTVSSLGLGTLMWGQEVLEDDAQSQLMAFYDAGGNFIDTSGSYAAGAAQKLLGKIVKNSLKREELIICSKAGIEQLPDGTFQANSGRKTLISQLEKSLRDIHTDYLDLWVVEKIDPTLDFSETLSTLSWAVETGKVRYVGFNNLSSWRLAQIQVLAQSEHFVSSSAICTEYSLINRSAENELLQAATALKVGVIGWSSLGRGVLTGRYRVSVPPESRAASSTWQSFVSPYLNDECAAIVEAVATAANGIGRTMAEVAISWAMHHQGITCSLVGAHRLSQLNVLLHGDYSPLPEVLVKALDDVSVNRRNANGR